jgi:hypothetical protein
MQALTVYQPWATLLVRGMKQYETRGWSTTYRGKLAIHAGKRVTQEGRDICEQLGLDFNSLPLGAIIGIAELIDVHWTHDVQLDWPENILGDFRKGRFAWQLGKRLELPEPIPCAGARQLWDVPSDIQGRIHRALNGSSS